RQLLADGRAVVLDRRVAAVRDVCRHRRARGGGLPLRARAGHAWRARRARRLHPDLHAQHDLRRPGEAVLVSPDPDVGGAFGAGGVAPAQRAGLQSPGSTLDAAAALSTPARVADRARAAAGVRRLRARPQLLRRVAELEELRRRRAQAAVLRDLKRRAEADRRRHALAAPDRLGPLAPPRRAERDGAVVPAHGRQLHRLPAGLRHEREDDHPHQAGRQELEGHVRLHPAGPGATRPRRPDGRAPRADGAAPVRRQHLPAREDRLPLRPGGPLQPVKTLRAVGPRNRRLGKAPRGHSVLSDALSLSLFSSALPPAPSLGPCSFALSYALSLSPFSSALPPAPSLGPCSFALSYALSLSPFSSALPPALSPGPLSGARRRRSPQCATPLSSVPGRTVWRRRWRWRARGCRCACSRRSRRSA